MLELRTPRLLLRGLRDADVPVLASLIADPDVARWWPDVDAEDIRNLMQADRDDDVTALAIEERQSGAVIGLVQLSAERDPQYRHAGIDLFLGSSYWGRGFGSEAVRAAVDHLIGARGFHRLVIDPAAANRRAVRCYEKVGFRPVGLMRDYERGGDGTWRDGLLMELLAVDRPGESADATPTRSSRDVTLRRALPSDQSALIPMMEAFNAGEQIVVDPDALLVALSRLLSDDSVGTVWFFEREGRVVGYAVVTYGYDLEFAGRDAFLTEIYVVPEARGGGIATAALAALEQAAAAVGVKALHLMVRFENAAAVRLYRSAGYASPPRGFLSKLL